jgi:RNA polymerase primary sigma factor
MSTRADLDYVHPFRLDEATLAFEEFEWTEAGEDALDGPEPSTDDVARSDIGYFLAAAGRFPLLTAEEERELGFSLWSERARLLRILRRAKRPRGRRSIPLEASLGRRPATPSSRRRLQRVERLGRELAAGTRLRGFPASGARGAKLRLERALRAIDSARRTLVERNLRLVVWVAKGFRGRGFDFVDLIQEGSLGLLRAVDRFDPRVGARFSTFATHWISQGIRRALAEKARAIRIPVNRIPDVRQTLRARSSLVLELGRAPHAREIAAAIGVAESRVEEILPALGAMDSIDATIRGTEKLLGETLEDRKAQGPLDAAMEQETRGAVRAVLGELPPRQRIILSMRHGIDYPHECTLDEIGDALGLSRERIRQVEKVATAAVRDWIEKHRPGLRP